MASTTSRNRTSVPRKSASCSSIKENVAFSKTINELTRTIVHRSEDIGNLRGILVEHTGELRVKVSEAES
jgi:hypothetical protein